MKRSSVHYIISALVLTVGGQALGVDVPTVDERCTEDSLGVPEAPIRVNWALKCNVLRPAEGYTPQEVADLMLYIKGDHNRPLSRPMYPTFTTAQSTNPAGYFAPPKTPDVGCNLPAGYVHKLTCTAGCYTPGERLLFNSGYVPIKQAFDLRASGHGPSGIVGLNADATLEKLNFKTYPVASYTISTDVSSQDVLTFRTQSGGSLTVTTNHPLLTTQGLIKDAIEFKVGESLLRADGHLDQIIAIEASKYTGKVYNLKPRSDEKLANVLVAEGFLTGSVWYQNEGYSEVNKIILRSTLQTQNLVD